MSRWRQALAGALLVALGGCANRDVVASSVDAGGASAFCQGSGPPVLLDGTCTGALTQRVFARAACTCSATSLSGDLVTDGFDSRAGPWVAGGAGGDVGAQGGLAFNGLLQVGGSLAVSGGGLEAGSTLRVAGDLDVGGALGRPGTAGTVGGAARIGGDVGVGSLAVTGTLTTPPTAAQAGVITAASRITAAVEVPAACPCGAGEAVDVTGLVARHQAANDDAAAGLAPDALALVTTATTVSLPCGRFYLDRIQGTGDVTLRATGRAALFLGQGITLTGSLTVALDPGAELDLFVAGPVNLPATLRIGEPARPQAVRVWVATDGLVTLPAGAQVAANLYAPAADLGVATALELYGAVMVWRIVNSATLSIHRDRAVASASAACGP